MSISLNMAVVIYGGSGINYTTLIDTGTNINDGIGKNNHALSYITMAADKSGWVNKCGNIAFGGK